MKVLYLTKYARNGASSRLRSFQYFSILNERGIAVTVKPFFDESYIHQLYSGEKISKISHLKFYLRRLLTLFTVNQYDALIIEKEIFPYFFGWFEKILYYLNIKYIADYDDAIFHLYDLNNNKLVRVLFKNKIQTVMKYSNCVLAGNRYLAGKARQSGAVNIVQFPTVINMANYVKKSHSSKTDNVIIGWIGSPATYKYLKGIVPQLSKLYELYPFELHVIGASERLDFIGNVKYITWTEEDEVALLSNLDIGIMPLENTPWELGKCAYKLIQYMGCGLPVVASSIGMNKEVVDDNVNGFLIKNEEDWIDKLTILINNPQLRADFGDAGREKIEREFNLASNVEKLIPIIKDAKTKQDKIS